MFLKSISFKKNVTFDSNRDSHASMFKVKTRTYEEENRRKPIYEDNKENSNYRRFLGYEKKTVIEKTFTIFRKGLTIEFNGNLTIIVGDNGCGKTSLIKNLVFPTEDLKSFPIALCDDPEKEKQKVISGWLENSERKLTFERQPSYIIVEKDIHKNSHIDKLSSNIGLISRHGKGTENMASMVSQMWDMNEASNGENNLDFLNGLTGIENALIVLDEPETSLSIKSQIKILNLIKQLAEKNQVIIITHSESIMGLNNVVYDFEKKKYIDSKKYIKSQKKIK